MIKVGKQAVLRPRGSEDIPLSKPIESIEIDEHLECTQFISVLYRESEPSPNIEVKELLEMLSGDQWIYTGLFIDNPTIENILLSKFGLHPHKFIPSEEDVNKTNYLIWRMDPPRIPNKNWIPKFVIILIQSVVLKKRLPTWTMRKYLETYTFIATVLKILFGNKLDDDEIKIIAKHINNEYITSEHLKAFDIIFTNEKYY